MEKCKMKNGKRKTLYTARHTSKYAYIPCTTAVVPIVKCTMGQKQKQLKHAACTVSKLR